ncbi:MAG: HPF/RaiA family ribosome-associated protein [Deltaproteobacteria bacterium]|nr:HPF/RaiA family ribosome-associated protein [Deltaproteobacteria bacterium]
MEIPLKITFRDIAPSPAIEANIREKAAKLDSLYDHIISCRVIVEAPHHHHHKGVTYEVHIDLTVPGGELAISHAPKRLAAAKLNHGEDPEKELTEFHEPSKHAAHEDVYVAIRDAFHAAGRKLQDHVRRQSGQVKVHEPVAVARIVKLFPFEDYGFLETPDRRELYFHRNSVLAPGFERLDVGTEVHFAEEMGDKGPQASTVRFTAG